VRQKLRTDTSVRQHQSKLHLIGTFQQTAKGKAWAAQLDSSVQNVINRWRKFEKAKGKCPWSNMIDHYSHARQLMSVTWQYLFVH
jgi:hypothetical protein